MREEEQRKRSLPKLGRRRWNGGELADGDPISPSNVWEREQQQRQ
jgi:hypothetical protein